MNDSILAYVIAVGIGCLSIGIQLGCIWASRVIREEYRQNPPPNDKCYFDGYDAGYTDGGIGRRRKWYR